MNVISFHWNLISRILRLLMVTVYGQNVRVVFNFAETVHTRNLLNKSHAKFKAFTVHNRRVNSRC